MCILVILGVLSVFLGLYWSIFLFFEFILVILGYWS